MGEYKASEDALDGSGMRVAVVAGRFNDHVTAPLLEGALGWLDGHGVPEPSSASSDALYSPMRLVHPPPRPCSRPPTCPSSAGASATTTAPSTTHG